MNSPIRLLIVFFVLISGILLLVSCQPGEKKSEILPFQDVNLPVGKRVDDLVQRMTAEEKVSQMLYNAPAIECLGVPAYNWWNEALHGVARAGVATVFPQAIGMAATWDDDLLFRVASVISDEGRGKYHKAIVEGKSEMYRGITFWSPNINIFRDPRWGRGQETYGEDPYLTSRMGVAFVKGLQGDNPKYLKTVATPKHFAVHSGPEPERHEFDARISDSDLRLTYLPAFRACVKEGHAYSVMGAYNRFMGEACCASPMLLQEILRGEWGFDGYVVSDCWAIANIFQDHHLVETAAEASALAVKAGCDLNCGDSYPALMTALENGLISETEIDIAVKRLFEARMKLGMFDPPGQVPWTKIPESVIASDANAELSLEVARKSIVLLKNEGNLLPLSKDIKSIAVIGPTADNLDVLLGNYHGTPPHHVTLLDGIRRKLPGAEVRYIAGSPLAEDFLVSDIIEPEFLLPPAGETGSGLKAEIFGNPDLQGEPVRTEWHSRILFPHGGWIDRPEGFGKEDNYSIRWTGRLVAPEAGEYTLTLLIDPKVKIYVDDKLVAEKDNLDYETISGDVQLNKGEHSLRIETSENSNYTMATLRWTKPWSSDIDKAVDDADAVVMVLGLSPMVEGEEMSVDLPGFRGGDRTSIELPGPQQKLLERVVARGKPTAMVILSGSAVAVEWADKHVPAIVQAWYPGQEGGTAVADVLFGDCNPSGRLPVTFYRSTDQLPSFDDYSMAGRTYRYMTEAPLYPFGHGLSYTNFSYSDLKIVPNNPVPGDSIKIRVTLKNTGSRNGNEVVQLYIGWTDPELPAPVRTLAGFKNLELTAGETTDVELKIDPRSFSLVDNEGRMVVEPGEYTISVGGKQPGFSGTADSPTSGIVSGKIVLEGETFELKP